jgi:transcriptional antiterminator RfaH
LLFWAVAQTESQRERLAQRFLEQDGFGTYLPMIHETKAKRALPLFPAYLFVEIVDHWFTASQAIGVVHLLMSGDLPAKLPANVVPMLRSRERDGIVRLPKSRGLQLGDRVRIIHGSFADQVGLYDGMDARQRVYVLLDLFGRLTRTEIAAADLRVI